jgi:hypothetical protein
MVIFRTLLKSGFQMFFSRWLPIMAAILKKTIQKPDFKSVQKMTVRYWVGHCNAQHFNYKQQVAQYSNATLPFEI